uniref:Ig-like domain-containing protein n=1 Tax=Dicentrarchus labrax TaxID=13489 RepID=A0A8C4IGU7_DICLA
MALRTGKVKERKTPSPGEGRGRGLKPGGRGPTPPEEPFAGFKLKGDLYFTVKLQNYTAVEKDEVILACELSKAKDEVKWFKDGNEIFPSKNILLQSDGKKRMLVIKKAAKSNIGAYTCDCGTDKTTADLNIEGNTSFTVTRSTFTLVKVSVCYLCCKASGLERLTLQCLW